MYYRLVTSTPSTEHIAHHGIKGQKWGVRRWQNEDGTLTPEGKLHYNIAAKASVPIAGIVASKIGADMLAAKIPATTIALGAHGLKMISAGSLVLNMPISAVAGLAATAAGAAYVHKILKIKNEE